jgi:aminopeptidase YwaD
MIKKQAIFFVLLLFIKFSFVLCLNSQNLELTKKRINDLASPDMHGRGYINNGAEIAAEYIRQELETAGAIPFGDSYFQNFSYSVNSFPEKVSLKVNGKKLKPGEEFMIGPASPDVKQKYNIFKPDSLMLNDTLLFLSHVFQNPELKNNLLVIDFEKVSDSNIRWFYVILTEINYLGFAGFVELLPDELMWSVRTWQAKWPLIKIRKNAFPDNAKSIRINNKSEFIKDFQAKNIIAYTPGNTDEFIVFVAHYDHLGRMGRKTFFPGAQDNASGTAMVLDFADYYSIKTPDYSIAYLLFFGEEAGLQGSKYYINNPIFDTVLIKLVINLDMVGTGDDGITIVNGAAEGYEDIFKLFSEINNEKKLLSAVNARGETANSDHYPFHKNNIKAIFIYSQGEGTFYHSVKDKPETLSYTGYNSIFKLISTFIENYE